MTNPIQKINLKANCILLRFTINTFGNRRKSNVELKTKAERTMFNVSKKLLVAPEMAAIGAFDAETRRVIDRLSSGMFSEGVRFLSLAMIEDTVRVLDERIAERDRLVNQLCRKLSVIKEDCRTLLGDQFDEDEYPTATKLRDAFGFTYTMEEFVGAAGALKSFKTELYKREQKKIAAAVQAEAQSIISTMREAAKELVDHFVEKLGGKEDGKPKIFRDTTVVNLVEFLDSLPKRNIMEDAGLAQLGDQMKKLLKGVDPDQLRKDVDIREDVRKKFTAIKKQLDVLVVEKPRRTIVFED